MFTDEEGMDFPPNPAVGNKEAMRRAIQVFYIMNQWAGLYLDYKDGEITIEDLVDKFNDELSVIGFAYKIEMEMDTNFMVELVSGHFALLERLSEVEKESQV